VSYVPKTWKQVYRELFQTSDYLIELEDYSQITEAEFKKQVLPQKRKVNIISFHIKAIKNMAIYTVKGEARVKFNYDIECKNEDDLPDKIGDRVADDVNGLDFEIDDSCTEIQMSDCQYTDQDELADRERDSER